MADSLAVVEPKVDALNLAGAEAAARIAFAQQEIASHFYEPALPPKPWAGRDELISRVASHFGIDVLDAVAVVDTAVLSMMDPDMEDRARIAKRSMRMRLVMISRILSQGLQEPRKETQYHAIEEVDPQTGNPTGKFTWKHFKEKRYTGPDVAIIGRLLEVERAIAKLDGLEGMDAADSTISIMEELDKVTDENTRKKVKVSLAQTIKTKPINDLSEDGKKRLLAALEEKNKAKKVDVKVVNEKEEDDEEEGGSEDE